MRIKTDNIVFLKIKVLVNVCVCLCVKKSDVQGEQMKFLRVTLSMLIIQLFIKRTKRYNLVAGNMEVVRAVSILH